MKNGLWYSLAVFTTMGFGDIVAVTTIGRIVTFLLSIYGIFIVALIPGVVINYYQEKIKIKAHDSLAEVLDEMERLPELSKEELQEISNYVKRKRYKI